MTSIDPGAAPTWPELRGWLANISNAIDAGVRILADALILGVPLYHGGEARAGALAAMGFESREGLWTRGRESYPDRPGDAWPGYLSVAELEDWRAHLLDKCVSKDIAVELPDPMTVAADDAITVSQAVAFLVTEVPGLRLTTSSGSDPLAQGALLMARGWLGWAQVVRLLLEHQALRDESAGKAADRARTACLIVERTEPGERKAVLAQLALRYGALSHPGTVGEPSEPMSEETFGAALSPYLDEIFDQARE